MSAIAEIYIVPRDEVVELEKASSAGPDMYLPALLKVSIARLQYEYSGWVLVTLLPVLKNDFQIDLESSEKELATALTKSTTTTHIVMTFAEKNTYADKLDSALFSPEELEKAYEAFNETDAAGVGEIMQNGIRFLRAGLTQLTPETLGLLIIG